MARYKFPTIFGALLRLHIWMKAAPAVEQMDDARISEAIRLEWARLRNFIRKRVADQGDAEDILQDVFYELIEAYRLMKPIEQVGAWLFRVARNRITDRFRKQRTEAVQDRIAGGENGDAIRLEDLLPSPEDGPMRRTRGACCSKNLKMHSASFPRSSARCSSPTRSRGAALRSWRRRAASVSTRCFRGSATRCCICAAGFRLFTTSLPEGEDRKMKPKWIARGLAFLILRTDRDRRVRTGGAAIVEFTDA